MGSALGDDDEDEEDGNSGAAGTGTRAVQGGPRAAGVAAAAVATRAVPTAAVAAATRGRAALATRVPPAAQAKPTAPVFADVDSAESSDGAATSDDASEENEDEDEDEGDDDDEDRPPHQSLGTGCSWPCPAWPPALTLVVHAVAADEMDRDDGEEEAEEPEGRTVRGTVPTPIAAPRLAQSLGLAPQQVQLTKASLFAPPAVDSTRPTLLPPKAPAASAIAAAEPRFGALYGEETSSAMPMAVTPLAPKIALPTPPTLAASSVFGKDAAGHVVDAGLMFGRSFRVGWGPGDRLVFASFGTVTAARVVPFDDVAGPSAAMRERTVASLETALRFTDVWVDDAGRPAAQARPRPAAAFAAAASDVTEHVRPGYACARGKKKRGGPGRGPGPAGEGLRVKGRGRGRSLKGCMRGRGPMCVEGP